MTVRHVPVTMPGTRRGFQLSFNAATRGVGILPVFNEAVE